jgi:hypothetical protein
VERVYFSAGPNGEANGAFGVIAPIPLPGAALLVVSALAGFPPFLRRKAPAAAA